MKRPRANSIHTFEAPKHRIPNPLKRIKIKPKIAASPDVALDDGDKDASDKKSQKESIKGAELVAKVAEKVEDEAISDKSETPSLPSLVTVA